MYVQITTNCNMGCQHCCFSHSKHKPGINMSREIFKKAIKLSTDFGGDITIGGGEPTIHPEFWEFFGLAMAQDVEYVWMATNGKKSNIAIALAGLASGSDKFGCALSQDQFHEPIKHHVVDAFRRKDLQIRDVSNHVCDGGAAFDNGWGTHNDCACTSMQINPEGDVRMCGCPDSLLLGHVNDIDDYLLMRAQEVGNDVTGNCGRDGIITDEIKAYIFDNEGELEDLE